MTRRKLGKGESGASDTDCYKSCLKPGLYYSLQMLLETSNKIIFFKEMRIKKKGRCHFQENNWWDEKRETGKNNIYRKSTVNKYQKLQSSDKISCSICSFSYKMEIIFYRRDADKPASSPKGNHFTFYIIWKEPDYFPLNEKRWFTFTCQQNFQFICFACIFKGIWPNHSILGGNFSEM